LPPSRPSRTTSARRVRNLHTINKCPFIQHQLTFLLPGKPVSHQFAKELLVGFAGAEVDRLAETKGADYIDREKAKRQAKQNAEQLYDQHYGGEDQYDPSYGRPQHINDSFGGGY